ncbi:DUF742 domain-containing protein [Streptomyces caniferus]|uniref:DUF742 domain-containing protein n=1 Tax=Streptomyces caniferus TaxID=285557 RepID=UPI00340F1543
MMAAGEPGPDEDGGPPCSWGSPRSNEAGSGAGAGSSGTGDAPDPSEPVGRAPAIRPFLLTAGRVAGGGTGGSLPVETQIVATSSGITALGSLAFEQHDIVAACRRPQSVAELAAGLRLHLNVVRVLAEDLRTAGHLAVHVPDAGTTQDISVLRRVIDGLRAVPDSRGALRDSG